ncbi:MAG: cytidine deaminase [Candidatus Obscuribacterales bacterium]|nr:cytidine deaminase [Candidatus Obscuribacterales bacterium]
MSNQKHLGSFIKFDALSAVEKEMVLGTWRVAENAYVPLSNFNVGTVILAGNAQGETRTFAGCNVENRFMNPTICAERNAAVAAVAAGYRQFLSVALVCKKYQGVGAISCGLCRQVLAEFGWNADLLSMANKENDVFKFKVGDMLPAAAGQAIAFADLTRAEKSVVDRVLELSAKAHVPYSKKAQAAVFSACNANGKRRSFAGVSDDNASYGGSALAACVAMRTARTAGYCHNVNLALNVDDLKAVNPVEGECLQVLREFGLDGKVLLLDANRNAVRTSLDELLPDSFGPQALA